MHSEPFKIKAWSFFWRPIENGSATHQLGTTDLDNQRLKEDMRLNMSSLVRFGRGPEKTTQPLWGPGCSGSARG